MLITLVYFPLGACPNDKDHPNHKCQQALKIKED